MGASVVERWRASQQASAQPTRRLFCLVLACLCLYLATGSAALGLDLNEMPSGLSEWWHGGTASPPASTERYRTPMEVDEKQQHVAAPPPPPPPPPPSSAFSLQTYAHRLWKRARDAVPSYFNFENFMQRFKRNYEKSEAYLRQSIFMSKIVEIFRARVEFRMGRLGYKQEVNNFTDMSRSEFELMFQPAPPFDWRDAPAVAAYRKKLQEHKERLKEVDQAYLMDINTESSLGDLGETAEARARRQLDERVALMRRELAREMNARELEALMESAVREELSGMDFEKMTQSALPSAIDASSSAGGALPWPGQLKSPDYMDTDEEDQGRPPPMADYEPPALAPNQALDWSRHACFHEVYNQGQACGRCYVYASTTLAEFYGCTELGPDKPIRRRKFSKDFVMDCAQKFSPNVMGCAGGSIYDTLRFIAHAGANNIRSWRMSRQTNVEALFAELAGGQPDPLDMRCPLDPHRVPFNQWGSSRVDMNPKRSHPNEWLEALWDGPLVVSVQMPPVGVDSYAGGVHDGRNCESSNLWHAMLLVGYGVSERGEPYWRFRNSFGPDWGDQGHFNLAMAVPGACLRESVRVYREPCKSCA